MEWGTIVWLGIGLLMTVFLVWIIVEDIVKEVKKWLKSKKRLHHN